jgi:uncharacterized membrane-anchored protein
MPEQGTNFGKGASSLTVSEAHVKGVHRTRMTVVICVTVLLLALIAILAHIINYDKENAKNYGTTIVALISTIVTALISGLSFLAGRKKKE